MTAKRADIQRFEQMQKIRIDAEMMEEEKAMLRKIRKTIEEPESLKRRYDALLDRIQKAQDSARQEYQLISDYIDRIQDEEIRQMLNYKYREGLTDPRIYRLIYGYNHPDAGSYIRHRLYKYLDLNPLPCTDGTEEKTDHDHVQRSKGSTAGGV